VKPSICFVSLNNYAVLAGDASVAHIGGAEVQQAHLARRLAGRGYRVSFVTLDHGQDDGVVHDGIRVYKAYAADSGMRGVRFLHPRLTGLCAAMRRADADVYYQRGIDLETGHVAAWCRRHGRRFIFAVAHDSNCRYDLPTRRGLHERWLCRYGLRKADTVISQTEFQRALLREQFGRESVLVRSCAADPTTGETVATPAAAGSRQRLLWVGRFSREKRLDLLLELAARCPEIDFPVVGKANGNSPDAQRLAARAAELGNVSLIGYVPSHQMGQHYRTATALLCTSSAEGFPNTFLEAWSRGLPVITTVDPDNLIADGGLGAVLSIGEPVGDERYPGVEAAAEALRQFVAEPDRIARCGAAARARFMEHHSIDAAADLYAEVIDRLAREARPRSGRSAKAERPVERLADTA
jgi:glycosyltransferase involved in cell wall biosynthesis